MANDLVIVESPAKAKTIKKFLGTNYELASSYGHIADLPAKELGVDVEKDFEPDYRVTNDKKDVVRKLKKLAKKSNTVWLASDEDREGEAIAWHLAEELDLKNVNIKRIVFHEITRTAIQNAIENPRDIDYNLVDAQRARRVLDRLVGYELSPILWRKVKGGLSAGRVQSVAVRLIVEREEEIEKFTPKSYFRVDGVFKTSKSNLKARLDKKPSSKQEAKDFLEQQKNAEFTVEEIEQKPAKKNPAPPFTTSTLQQDAARKLYFPVSKTMSMAQRLYESGLITYMRTDSTNLSFQAKQSAERSIKDNYGDEYHKRRNFKTKNKDAQEAHEAIRPTNFDISEIDAERDQQRLYELIWKRAIASQMSEAKLERTNLKIGSDKSDAKFTAKGEVVKFDGFLKVYLESKDEDEEDESSGILPPLKEGEKLDNASITAIERFTKPKARYTEASLVKELEKLGIGRPSTYAPTISTIQNRKYIQKGEFEGEERKYTQLHLSDNKVEDEQLSEKVGSNKGKLVPTDVGRVVNDFLVNHFKGILDYHFTAKLEEDFDKIAQGNKDWRKVMNEFYDKFHPNVKDVAENAEREVGERVLGKDPKTGKPVSARLGKFGPMVQIGSVEDEEKPRFASLQPGQTLQNITYDEAMDLFKLPKELGEYEGEPVMTNVGRYGPYVKHGKKFISLEKGEDPLDVSLERAKELIEQKKEAEKPIYHYKGEGVQKGIGRFGPYLKWNGMFINVNKKYDFDNLSEQDIEELIEDKLKKEKEKLIHHWEDEGIKVEKTRWGRSKITKGKKKVEMPKTFDAKAMSLQEAKEILEKNTKGAKKKAPAKKKKTKTRSTKKKK